MLFRGLSKNPLKGNGGIFHVFRHVGGPKPKPRLLLHRHKKLDLFTIRQQKEVITLFTSATQGTAKQDFRCIT